MKFFIKQSAILLLIIFLGLFMRLYKLEVFFPFGHDQDLFSWIAKDIVIDKHLRLIGQETSITGVFIGPLFYYVIALSFAIFKMNPLSAALPTTVLSLLTIFSIYWVFNKFFGKKIGLIGAFLYAISPGAVFLDRWVVPTQPTMLWTIWYFYVLLSIQQGRLPLVVLSLLIGLIWHIHIAFIPLLALLPVAFWLSGKKIQDFKWSLNSILVSILVLFFLITPFFAFELRHNFQQIKAVMAATYMKADRLEGVNRLVKIFDSGGRSLAGAFVLSGPATNLNSLVAISLPFLLLSLILYFWLGKILKKEIAIIFIVWFGIVFFGQFFSKRIITEYYFNNLFVILFLLLALILRLLRNNVILIIYAGLVLIWFIGKPDDLGGFLYKNKVIEFIKSHSQSKNYPCVAINFIEIRPGAGSGYRYLYWYYKLHVITSGDNTAVYSIVNPWTISRQEVAATFGNLGVIFPSQNHIDSNLCTRKERQLLPLWGFTN